MAGSEPAQNLDDTSRCPLGVRCECCGADGSDLSLVTSDLGSVGVAYLTMCSSCAASAVSPPVAVGTAVRLVLQHVGVDGMDGRELFARYTPYAQHTY